MRKSLFFYVHSTAGLVTGLFILLMSVSGSLLVFHEELDQLQYPETRLVAGAAYVTPGQAYEHLRAAYPLAQINSVALPVKTGDPYLFSVADPSYFAGQRTMQVFIHPQSGKALLSRGGSKDFRGNTMAWLSSLHSSLLLKKTGEWLLGVFAVVFCISLVTGTILYRKNILPVLLCRKEIYSINNLHQVIGVYALLFNLALGISGFWMQRYVFKKSFYQTFPSFTVNPRASPPMFFPLDSAIHTVNSTYTGFTPYVIYFPRSRKSNTALYGSRAGNSFIHSKKFADAVFLDSTGAVARTAFVNEVPAADRYDIVNSQLHMGKYGGWPVKVLYCLLGFTGAFLSISGARLWWRRNKIKS